MSLMFKSQVAPKGLSFSSSDFYISDHYATIMTVVSYPKYIMPGYLSSLTNMSGIKVVVKHIPVPFSEGYTATCVEAIWQGLKVFEGCGVDVEMFKNDTMKNIKRTVRRFGKPLGHRKGVHGTELLGYIQTKFPTISDNMSIRVRLGQAMKMLEFDSTHRAHISYYKAIPLKSA